jgi:hypothetical protein
MKAIIETLLAVVFVLFWMVVLPVAGLVEIGIVVSDNFDRKIAIHSASSSA